MAFSKDIQLCKEHRKQYRGSAVFDRSCRPQGGCGWCEDDRTFQDQKARSGADARLKDIETEIDIYKDSI
jgi:hypothetical protein